jgi:RNase P subunit RPR2
MKRRKGNAMRPCTKCLEWNWRFSFDDQTRIVTATCQSCEAEVSFPAQKRNTRPIDPKRLQAVSLAHRYVPGNGKLPWEA